MQTSFCSVSNWSGTVRSTPAIVVKPRYPGELAEVLKNPKRYPSPVRPLGAHHSTTCCAEADSGTLVDMTAMNDIIEITKDSVTAEAGARYVDVAKKLLKRDKQFYVNLQIGDLTLGSAACCATKDGSMSGEFGQASSYVTAVKLLTPDGRWMTITEERHKELMHAVRSSYGLLGIVCEATFRIRPLEHIAVEHRNYSIDEFLAALPELRRRNRSMVFYIFPFAERVTVQLRNDARPDACINPWVWWVRNWGVEAVYPVSAHVITRFVPTGPLRYGLIDGCSALARTVVQTFLHADKTIPTDQMTHYSQRPGIMRFVFSMWAFPVSEYPRILREYLAFCQKHYRERNYRCNLPSVGYSISRDDNALFSYSLDHDVMTIDPVSTGDPGWEDFLDAYNGFCSANHGTPLLNQTPRLSREATRKAFGTRIDDFQRLRRRFDPEDRLYSGYFRQLLE